MYKIVVIMSTYNGEKYLETQLNSILYQKGVKSLILVRDDQSSDNTCEILERYRVNNDIKWYQGSNLGAAKSFLDLLLNVKNYVNLDEIDYIALADQDDIWDIDKLYLAATALSKNKRAALYCGALDAFTENNDQHHIIVPKLYSMIETLIRNSTAGCTMVFTKELLARINDYQPSWIIMHDAWIMQICNILEKEIIVDSNPHMRYRLHHDNVCGAAISTKQKIEKHLKCIFNDSYASVSKTAHELLVGYKVDMAKEYIETLKVIDSSEKVLYRRLKLILLGIKEQFSNRYRKVVFIIEIIVGKV